MHNHLIEQLAERRIDEAMYRDLLEKAERARRELEKELASQYKDARCTADLAVVRRRILGVLKQQPNKLWGLRDIAQYLPEYSHELIGRQLKYLASRTGSGVLWNHERGPSSKYGLRHG